VCGRFIFNASPEEVQDHFGLDARPDIAPRYNVAPSQLVPVIAPKPNPAKRGLALLKWGLVPMSRP
jgi:putative SOS response-associated peptidase YedK